MRQAPRVECSLEVGLACWRTAHEGRPCRFHSCGRTETRCQDSAPPDGEGCTSPNLCSQARDDSLSVHRDSRPIFNFCVSKRSRFVPGRVQRRAVVKALDQTVKQTRSVFMGQAKYFKFERFQRGRHGVPQGSRSKKNTSLPQDQTIRQSPAGDRPSSDAASRDRSRSHAYPRCGSMFHICRAYSRIVRSDEKLPMPATLAMAHAAQALLWRYSASTRSCVCT